MWIKDKSENLQKKKWRLKVEVSSLFYLKKERNFEVKTTMVCVIPPLYLFVVLMEDLEQCGKSK